MLAQWGRWLPVYLSSVRLEQCGGLGICKGQSFEPLCTLCPPTDEPCILCQRCRKEFESWYYNFQDGVCMTKNEYGLINGFGFTLTFSTFGLLAGLTVDVTIDRVSTILGASALFTGLVCLLHSYCTNFTQVLILRSCLGALQAFSAPASSQLITSHFKRPSDRPIANAAYTVGLYLGAGLSSLSTIISQNFGWQCVFRIVGLSGIAVALIFELFVDLKVTCLSFYQNDYSSSNLVNITGGVTSGGNTDHYNKYLNGDENVPLLKGNESIQKSFKPPSNGDSEISDTVRPISRNVIYDHSIQSFEKSTNSKDNDSLATDQGAGDVDVSVGLNCIENYKENNEGIQQGVPTTVEYTYFSHMMQYYSSGSEDDDFSDDDCSGHHSFVHSCSVSKSIYKPFITRGSDGKEVTEKLSIGDMFYLAYMGDKVAWATPLLLWASSVRYNKNMM